MKLEKCPITGSTNAVKFLDLGKVPIEGNLCDTREQSLSATKYPMTIQFFPDSKLITLEEYLDKDLIFKKYLYHSGVNKPYLRHCDSMYNYLTDYLKFNDGDVVADIGGNDGSLLLQFKTKNSRLKLINVECSESFVKVNNENKITYINEYFGEDTVFSEKAKLITSTNVFQHTEPIRSFVKGIVKNLSKKGIWCLEFPYMLATVLGDCYDQVYHEHVYFYTLSSITQLLEQEGLKIINVSFHDIHNGTMRILSVHKSSKRSADSTVSTFLNLEKILTKEYYINWGNHISKKIDKYTATICSLKDNGYKIAGFGAAIKGCVFLNTCKINYNQIDYVIDDTKEKQGKFIPGTGIEVIDRKKIKTEPPDYILILAHNFKDYIIESLRKDGYKGKFLIMFPDVTII